MPTWIDGVAVVRPGWRTRRSARLLADEAARRAMRRAGCQPDDVDLLVNAGLYHDRNLGEPALGPLIQEDIGAHARDPFPGGVGTFSFDVANGSAGVLNALQIVDGFMRAGTISTALVLASDADPGHGLAPGFPFEPAGGALLCRHADRPGGVGCIRWCRDGDGGAGFRATVGPKGGRNALTVEQSPAFAEHLVAPAATALEEVMAAEGLSVDHTSLVLVSPGAPELLEGLAAATRIPAGKLVGAGHGLHTVAPLAGLDAARRSGRLEPGATVVVVAGAAGLTAGAMIYRT